MKIPTGRLNLLIGLNCFLLFFVAFESFIQVPSWLQVLGRAHPMVLHFPIVLLLMAGVLVNFRERLLRRWPIESVTAELLFVAALTAVVTAIMGLMLSQEEGYEGTALTWHKWTGVAIPLLATAMVVGQPWQDTRYRWGYTVLTNLCLLAVLIAGHYGATLTHGEGFVTEPFYRNKAGVFDIRTARVFDDAVRPLLQAKCLSCHNTGKSKGDLILADSASIAKGGKNGPLFPSESLTESLLIQRLMLDVEHEHHMPPKGKPQLTPEELALLQAWVSEGAPFDRLVASLRPDDSLMVAIGALYTVNRVEEKFDFPSADAGQIEKLSNPYRTIRVLADGSPALSVNFYGVEFYSDESLMELEPIAEQVVSLNLNGMPLGEKGLEMLAKFTNLRSINLDGTPLDDQGLTALRGLAHLNRAGLSGTAVTAAGIRELLANEALRNVFVWHTAVTPEEVTQLQASFPAKTIEIGFVDDGQVPLSLTEPQIEPTRTFFREEMEIHMSHPIPGVQIRYTLDGTEPDSLNSPVFDASLSIVSNQQLAVKAFKEGWVSSPTVRRSYVKSPKMPDRIVLLGRPNNLYPARRERSLFDLESGGANHADGRWQGYRGTLLAASLHFDEPTTVDTLMLSVMQNYYGITYMPVYAPEYIEVWGGSDSTQEKLLAKVMPVPGKPEQLEGHRLIECPIHTKDLRYLRVVAQPYPKIPDGYPGTGMEAWMFVDEIILK